MFKNYHTLPLVMVACIIGLLGLWLLDIAHLTNGVSNGFWIIGSDKAFHVGITIAIASFIFIIFRSRQEK